MAYEGCRAECCLLQWLSSLAFSLPTVSEQVSWYTTHGGRPHSTAVALKPELVRMRHLRVSRWEAKRA